MLFFIAMQSDKHIASLIEMSNATGRQAQAESTAKSSDISLQLQN